jgi:aminopeptidase YwaD
MKKLLLIVVFVPSLLFAQSKKQKKAIEAQRRVDELVMQNLKSHIRFLADDKLEGRATGSKGEELAMQYISEQFKTVGLEPKGTNGFVQQFTIEDGKKIEPTTALTINSKLLQLNKEWFPLAFSADKSCSGAAAIALRESKEPWFLDVKDLLQTNKTNTAFNIDEAIQKEASAAATKGATAFIVFNSSTVVDNIRFDKKYDGKTLSIPVAYVTPEGLKKHLKDRSALLDVELNVATSQRSRFGRNVIGYINNNASQTIIIGAHYDHLGFGEDANALDTGKIVRHGADDNASGISALIELARTQKQSAKKSNNYLFIAFSGEELGLLGSNYWIENPTVTTPINFMVNLDMIGRYDKDRKLIIGGFGTSPQWGNIISASLDNKIVTKLDSTGAGPSDHATFYRKNIPVLFLFTGNHTDYHKATDVADKINIEGEYEVVKLVSRILDVADSKGKLAFQKTAEPQIIRGPLTVSLGVIPDYSYSGNGLRISGVSPKRTAESIGLVSGDILTKLGNYKIFDINSYMNALGGFKKGDRTKLWVKRGADEKEFEVEFQ